MRFQNSVTDEHVLSEIGARLRAVRLRRNLSQQTLADEAGVGRVTLQRMEEGGSSSTTSLVRVLRALDLLDGMEALLPGAEISPVELVRRRGRPRTRAGANRRPADRSDGGLAWGDEEGGKG